MLGQPPRRDPASDAGQLFANRGWLAREPAPFRALIMEQGIPIDVPAGELVYRADEQAIGLYGVIAGGIGVEGAHARQRPVLGHVHRPGDWFGIRGPLGAGPRLWTFRAMEPSRVMMIPNSRLLPLMQSDPGVAISVGRLAEQANRLAAWGMRDLLTPDAGQRLASVLLRVVGMGEVVPRDPKGFWLTHQQLGEMANLSRHHVGRKLALFEARGWISCGYSRILLRDAQALADFAYGDDQR
jgi:CRP-like cAMP-binding protein